MSLLSVLMLSLLFVMTARAEEAVPTPMQFGEILAPGVSSTVADVCPKPTRYVPGSGRAAMVASVLDQTPVAHGVLLGAVALPNGYKATGRNTSATLEAALIVTMECLAPGDRRVKP